MFSAETLVTVHLFANGFQNLPSRLHAQISSKQCRLQILQNRRINLPFAEKKIVSTVSESAALVLLTEFFSRSRSVGSGSFLPKREIITVGGSTYAQSKIVAEAEVRNRIGQMQGIPEGPSRLLPAGQNTILANNTSILLHG